MENEEIDLTDLLKSVWSQRKKIIKWGIIGACIGLVIACSIPKQYVTVVKIAPESKSKSSSGSLGMFAEMAGTDLGLPEQG